MCESVLWIALLKREQHVNLSIWAVRDEAGLVRMLLECDGIA
jgi:hypothetical protein